MLWGVATHSTHAGSGDEPHYLAIAHSLAFDFDLDLANNYGPAEPLIAAGGLSPEAHVRPGVDGRARPVHDIGMPLLFTPYVRLVRPLAAASIPYASSSTMRRLRLTPTTLYRHLLSAAMILIAAGLAVSMARTFRDLGTPETTALLAAVLVAASPPFLVMSLLFFTEVLSALLCLTVFRLLVRTGTPSTRSGVAAGGLLGLLLLVHIRNLGLVVGLVVAAAWHIREAGSWRPVGAIFAGLLPLVALRASLNFTFWGSLWTSPHAALGLWPGWQEALSVMTVRAGGLLLDQEFGLLPYAPIFVLAPIGLVLLARTRRLAVLAIVVVIAAYLLPILCPVTNVHGWSGGWSPAARFVVPVLPLAAVGIAWALRSLPGWLTVPVVVLQVVVSAYFWQNPKNLWNDGDGVAAVCSRGGFTGCEQLPSFVTPADFHQSR